MFYTCCRRIWFNVTVDVETPINEDQLLSDPGASWILVKHSPTIRVGVSWGGHCWSLARHLQPYIILQSGYCILLKFTGSYRENTDLGPSLVGSNVQHFLPFRKFIFHIRCEPNGGSSCGILLWPGDLETVRWTLSWIWCWESWVHLLDGAAWQEDSPTGSGVLDTTHLISPN